MNDEYITNYYRDDMGDNLSNILLSNETCTLSFDIDKMNRKINMLNHTNWKHRHITTCNKRKWSL